MNIDQRSDEAHDALGERIDADYYNAVCNVIGRDMNIGAAICEVADYYNATITQVRDAFWRAHAEITQRVREGRGRA